MSVLSKLWKSIGNLANAFDALAAVVDAAAGRLRQQLALESPPAGEVIDQPAELPAAAEAPSTGRARRGEAAAKARA